MLNTRRSAAGYLKASLYRIGVPLMGKNIFYVICIRGILAESWSERLGDMVITTDHSSEKGPVTTLKGRLRDQAALSGVLNSLYELHLPVLKVDGKFIRNP